MKTTFLTLCCGAILIISCKNKSGENAQGSNGETNSQARQEIQVVDCSTKDSLFLVDAITANTIEIRMVQLAEKKATNEGTRTLMLTMEKDHSALLKDLKSVAAEKGMTISDSLRDNDKAALKSLNEKGNDFEAAVFEELKQRHEKSVALFESMQEKCYRTDEGNSSRTRDLVNTYLPTIRMHLEMINTAITKHQ